RNLLPARRAARHKHVTRPERPGHRKQTPLADGLRHLEVTTHVTERPGHAATACIRIDDRRAGNSAEQRFGRREIAHRFLMTMTVDDNARGTSTECQGRTAGAELALEPVLEESRPARNNTGFPAI